MPDYLDLLEGSFFLCLKQKQARSSGKLPALLLPGSMPQTSANDMIYFVSVQLKNIFEQGKNYPWVKPEICPACGHYKVWGHGFSQILPRLPPLPVSQMLPVPRLSPHHHTSTRYPLQPASQFPGDDSIPPRTTPGQRALAPIVTVPLLPKALARKSYPSDVGSLGM